MLKLYVLQNRQLTVALGVGLALVLSFFLAYLAMKRPRNPPTYQHDEAPGPFSWRQVWSYMPWILILVYAATFVYSLIDITWKSMHPPNY